MKASTQYEYFVAEYFRGKGYEAIVTPVPNDFGVDVIIRKDAEKIAVQAKMYGGSTRKVNRKSIMELHGAKSVFDCDKAYMVTNGSVLSDAKDVAVKLGIEIIYLPFTPTTENVSINNEPNLSTSPDDVNFSQIWQEYIMPLKGQTITGKTGLTNKIIDVNFFGVTRITKNDETNKIPIDAFKWAINRILTNGIVTRDEINQEFVDRLSSGTILILSQVPLFTTLNNPLRIVYTKK